MGIGESLAVERNVRPDRNLHAVYWFVGLENDVQFLNYQEFLVSTVVAFGGITAP